MRLPNAFAMLRAPMDSSLPANPPPAEALLARDLKRMEARASHMTEWTEPVLRRYHAALASNGSHPDAACLHGLHAWLFVPFSLWPFNIHHVINGCLTFLEGGKRLPPRLRLLTEMLPAPPDEPACESVTAFEHRVQSGDYADLLDRHSKFRGAEADIRSDPQLLRDWARLKAAFKLDAHRDHKGVIRRSMCVERNLRPAFSVNVCRSKDVFAAAFDAFCLRWNLYGMQDDEPLLLKVAVSVTPYGTMIHIPAYWSLDIKRDLRWKVIARLHDLRVGGRQGDMLTAGKAERRRQAGLLPGLDREARERRLKGDARHLFLCQELGLDPGTSPKRISRLRKEFKKEDGRHKISRAEKFSSGSVPRDPTTGEKG